jgi:FkbM family methyltransferase
MQASTLRRITRFLAPLKPLSRRWVWHLLDRGWVRFEAPEIVDLRWDVGRIEIRDCRENIQSDLYFRGTWEEADSRFVRNLLRAGDVVVDVGANLGWYSLLAARTVGPGGRVLCVEPSAALCDRLRHTVELNALGNVIVERCALSEGEGEARLFALDHTNSGLGSIMWRRVPEDAERVPTRSMDGLLGAHGIERARLAKIDVEGAEALVMAGMQRTLERAVFDYFVIEVGGPRLQRQGTSARAIVEAFEKHGYRCQSLVEGRPGVIDYERLEKRGDSNLFVSRW